MLHGDLLGERARLTPSKLALVDVATGARLTYAELDARASRCAALLRRDLGLAKGDRFGILASNRLEYLDFFFAAGKSGAAIVPLGTRLTAHELSHIIRDSGLRVLIYDESFGETVRVLRDQVSLDHWMSLDDGPTGAGCPASPRLESARAPAGQAGQGTREHCGPEDLYALLYTSGTTGRPKGVMIPHRMVAWNGYNTVASWQLREDDVSPIFTPLYHAGALGAFLVPIVTIGGTIVLHKGFDASEVWHTIATERCTVVLGVPTIWKTLMEAPEFTTADLSSVRAFMCGGAPLPEYIAEAYQRRGVAFKQGYGLTEVGVNCFTMTVDDSLRKRGSIGKPLMMTEARLLDEQGREVAGTDVGELCLRGSHVCQGYWNNPDATAAALDGDGWFHTGDLARRDADGFFYIAGRRKDMFISGGVNVYPAEIEAELLQHPSVADAAVIGIPHETWGEVGLACVVPRSEDSVSAEALTAFLQDRLARYKIPKAFVTMDALPRTAYGKVQKQQLLLTHSVIGDGPPLLLLNGGLMSYAAWDPLVAVLATSRRVIRCDFRGQLLSPGDPPATLAGHADDVVRLLDALGIQSAHIAGASFGALVGLTIAGRVPSRVRSLMAITATDRMTPEMDASTSAMREAAIAADAGRIFDMVTRATWSPEFRAAQAAMLAARRQAMTMLPRTWFSGLDHLLAALPGMDLRPLLSQIECPALVIGGDADVTFPVEHSRELAARIPNATLVVICGGWHGLCLERATEVTLLITEFVARAEQIRCGAAL